MTVRASSVSGSGQIDCSLNVQNPHNSSHVRGTVNVVVVATCTSTVDYISLNAALYQNNNLVNQSGSTTSYNVSSKQSNAAVSCSDATYQGWGSYYIKFPSGYLPDSISDSKFGNAVSITC